ncbi:MAG TPA: hypothetical protein PK955_05195 [Methanoregulaceae archaeon]|nr:hypothetical protein [Methanoregulaceae archaeon]
MSLIRQRPGAIFILQDDCEVVSIVKDKRCEDPVPVDALLVEMDLATDLLLKLLLDCLDCHRSYPPIGNHRLTPRCRRPPQTL